MTSPILLSLERQQQGLRSRAFSSLELTRWSLEQAHRLRRLNAVLSVDEASARAQAEAADRRLAQGDAPPLTGIPLLLKDNLCVEGQPLTCGSRLLAHYRPPYSATSAARLQAQGAILLGKTNLDEFAMGSSTEHSAFGPCLNPWGEARTPGGSSGGSAAAVAARIVAGALGSDTGGSIRQPAALCGVVGLKPTWGRVSRFGLTAFGSSLDQVGPLARTVSDVALLLQAIAGPDPLDATCATVPVPDFGAELEAGVKGLTIGVPREYFAEGLSAELRAATEAALEQLERQGARRVDVSLPLTDAGIAVYYVLAAAEAASNLSRFDGIRFGTRALASSLEEVYTRSRSEGLGPEVQRRILLGTYVLSAGYHDAWYGRAAAVRASLRAEVQEVFRTCDCLLTPTTPTTAFLLGEKADPLSMYLADVYTVSANLAGIPAISLPGGFDQRGLPIGVQLLAPHFQEARLLRVARGLERALALPEQPPPCVLEALERSAPAAPTGSRLEAGALPGEAPAQEAQV